MEAPPDQLATSTSTSNNSDTKPAKSFYCGNNVTSVNTKLEVSRIALKSDCKEDIIYKDHDGKFILHSPALGTLYDRCVPEYPSFSNHCEESFSNDISTLFHQVIEYQHVDEVHLIKKDTLLEKQATAFLELFNQLISDSSLVNRSMLVPTLSAILACINASWKPHQISMQALEVLVDMLDDRDLSTILMVADVLIGFAKNSNIYAVEIISRVMENIAKLAVSPAKLQLIDNCLQVLTTKTIPSLLSEATKEFQKRKLQLVNAMTPSRVKTLQVSSLSLGDELEVSIEGKWKRAHIVKINHMRNEYFVEYHDGSGRGGDLVTRKVSLDDVRPLLSEKQEPIYDARNQSLTNDQQGSAILNILSEFDYISKILAVIYISRSDIPERSEYLNYNEDICCPNGHQCQLFCSPMRFACGHCKAMINPDSRTSMNHLEHSWLCVSCQFQFCLNCCPCFKVEKEITVCFLGTAEAKILCSPEKESEVIGVISSGTVVDVIDNPASNYFKMVGLDGYLFKDLPSGCMWKELNRQRYEMHDDNPTLDELNQLTSGTKDKTVFRNSAFLSSIIQQYLLIDEAKQRLVKDVMSQPKISLPSSTSTDNVLSATSQKLEALIQVFLQTSLEMLKKNLAVEKLSDFEYSDIEDTQEVCVNDTLLGLGENGNDNKNTPANIFQLLMSKSNDSSEKVALLSFQWLFEIIISEVTNFAENLLQIRDSILTKNAVLAYNIIYVLSRSKYSNILIPTFFRVMIAKSGLKAKEFAKRKLSRLLLISRPHDLKCAVDYFHHFDNIAMCFMTAITHPCIGLTNTAKERIRKKVIDTVAVLGPTRFANGLILQYHDQSFQSETSANELKSALMKFMLMNQSRTDMNARQLRILLRLLEKNAAPRNLLLIETMWKETICSFLQDELLRTAQSLGAHNVVGDNNHHVECVIRLQFLLEKVRKCSRRDMSVLNICYTTADSAFELAFRRLPKEMSINLSKAVVVYLSSLVDSLKSQQLVHQWSESLDGVVDLIKVIFNQSSVEFHHFYEALLARRLLKGRYFSITIEKRLLKSLPYMPKCEQLMKDIEKCPSTMESFRNYVIQRVDDGTTTASEDALNIIFFDNRLGIHVLTAALWPMFLLEPLRFANLHLPRHLADIKREFLQHFEFQNATKVLLEDNPVKKVERSVIGYAVTGCEENSSRINGKYFSSAEFKDGWPVYEMEGNLNSILEYSTRTNSWQIKKRSDKGKNTGWAYLKVSSGCSPCGKRIDVENITSGHDEAVGTNSGWLVWKKSIKKWVGQPIVVSEIFAALDDPINHGDSHQESASNNTINWLEAFPSHTINLESQIPADRMKSSRRLIWCHNAGVITLECIFPDNFKCFIQVSEPQAAALMMFSFFDKGNPSQNEYFDEIGDLLVSSPSFSYADIKHVLYLNDQEVELLLASLSSDFVPLLECSVDNSGDDWRSARFRLSTAFRSKALGGHTELNPILATNTTTEGSMSSDYQLTNAGVQNLQNWKNQVVDAAIVRVLKYAAQHKCGEFPNKGKHHGAALSADTLSFRVRNILANKAEISVEDILRRCEGLVTMGIIEKVTGNLDSLRSIAYAYLPEPLIHRDDSLTNANRDIDADEILKLSGKEFFNHMRMVLGMKGNASGESGISYQLFCVKLLSWLLDSQAMPNIDSTTSPIGCCLELVHVAGTMLTDLQRQLTTLVKQLYQEDGEALRRFDEGVISGRSLMGFSSSPVRQPSSEYFHFNMESLEEDMTTQIIFECLPIDIIRAIYLNFCKICQFDVTSSFSSSAFLPLECLLDEEKWHQQGDLDRELEDDLDSLLGSFSKMSVGGILETDRFGAIHTSTTPTSWMKREALIAEIRKIWKKLFQIKLSNTHYSLIGSEVFSNSLPWREYPVGDSPGRIPIGEVLAEGFTLMQYVSMILDLASQSDSAQMSSSSTTEDFIDKPKKFSDFLREFYVVRLVNAILKVTKLEINYREHAQNGKNDNDDAVDDILNTLSQTEEMIPCEFCTDSIPASMFEAHIIVCGAGRLGLPPLNLLDGQLAVPNNRINEWIQMVAATAIQQSRQAIAMNSAAPAASNVNKDSRQSIINKTRPSTLSPIIFRLASSLIGINMMKMSVELSQQNQLGEKIFPHPTQVLEEGLQEVFTLLDRDGDSLITSHDFTFEGRAYNEIAMDLDPVALYGIRVELTPGKVRKARSMSKAMLWSSEREDKNQDEVEDMAHQLAVTTPVFLRPTDSLWMSVSNEKSLPALDVSRSFRDMEEAEEELSLVIENVQSILGDSESVSTALLLYYKWDVKTLVEDYIDNSRAVRLRTGLGPRAKPPFYRHDYYFNAQCTKDDDDDVLCAICGDDVPSDQAFALHCLHWYCSDCWKGYMDCAIQDKKLMLFCPHPNCKCLVTLDMQRYFLDHKGLEEINALLIRSFIEERRGKRVVGTYCKNPRGCSGVVFMAEDANSSEAVCSLCSTSFCAACDLPPHSPATCEMVASWEAKGGYLETGQAEDAEARKLKHLTTKPCPRCGVRIEKNGGCPHMTCVRQNCKYQFCWECSGEFHTSTQCTRPKVNIDNNSILLFDEFDRQCANHFLARQVALKGKSAIQTYLLEINTGNSGADFESDKFSIFSKNQAQYGTSVAHSSNGELIHVCSVIKEGWTILAEAQSALAHTCIVMFTVKSAKLQFIFDQQKEKTLLLQQRFEEEWLNVGNFPVYDAKLAISDLRMRLKTFIADVQSDIIVQTNSGNNGSKANNTSSEQMGTPRRETPETKVHMQEKLVFGNAFGGSGKIYRSSQH